MLDPSAQKSRTFNPQKYSLRPERNAFPNPNLTADFGSRRVDTKPRRMLRLMVY
jgi:hypothetical protein